MLSHVDINGTNGGLIFENDYDNTFIGCAQNDTFALGSGQSIITFNGGFGKAVFLYNDSVAYLNDFTSNHTIWFATTQAEQPAVKVQAWGLLGTQVSLSDGPTAYLANFAPGEFNAIKPVAGGGPQVTAKFIHLRTSSPATDLMTLNLPALQPSHPYFDPCEHYGNSGFGGPSVAGCAG